MGSLWMKQLWYSFLVAWLKRVASGYQVLGVRMPTAHYSLWYRELVALCCGHSLSLRCSST